MTTTRRRAVLAAAIGAAFGAAGCVPLAATGIAVGTLAAIDRRTVASQASDTEIELRAANRLPDAIRGSAGVSVTSYNQRVLLTGRVPDETARVDAERAVRQVPNVREVFNELEVGPRLSFGSMTADTAVTARVKGAFIEQRELSSNVVKVVTDNSIVYLMGLVTQREGPAYATAAARVGGIRRVVTLYEYLTDEELAKLGAR